MGRFKTICVVLLVLSLVGCTIGSQEKIEFEVHLDLVTYQNLSELVEMSDVIVIGKFTKIKNDFSVNQNQETPYVFNIRLYEFEVKEYIKGKGFERINVGFLYQVIYNENNKKTIGKVKSFIEPETNKSIIMFLRFNEEIDSHYTGAAYPFMFSLGDGNIATAIESEHYKNSTVNRITIDKIKELVNP